MAFSLKVFRPVRGATNTQTVELEFEYDCSVTNLSWGESVSEFRPEIPREAGSIRVFDSRYTAQAYQYVTAAWLPAQLVTNSPGFKSWARSHTGPMPSLIRPSKKSNRSARHAVMIAFGIVFFSAPALFFYFAFREKSKSRHSSTN
jgi:hypothetical protein